MSGDIPVVILTCEGVFAFQSAGPLHPVAARHLSAFLFYNDPDMSLNIGDRAPAISGPDFKLSQHKGETIVVFFFPKADTPGCTTESCDFRDRNKKFTHKGATIVGISPDTADRQSKFAMKYELPYTFVPDPDHKIAEAYGVWKEKKNYGRTYMGIERTTFLIDGAGKIAKIFPKVRVAGHAQKVLEALDEVG